MPTNFFISNRINSCKTTLLWFVIFNGVEWFIIVSVKWVMENNWYDSTISDRFVDIMMLIFPTEPVCIIHVDAFYSITNSNTRENFNIWKQKNQKITNYKTL